VCKRAYACGAGPSFFIVTLSACMIMYNFAQIETVQDTLCLSHYNITHNSKSPFRQSPETTPGHSMHLESV